MDTRATVSMRVVDGERAADMLREDEPRKNGPPEIASHENAPRKPRALVEIADRTAKAAKEGGFLGFGGEWVSACEREVISRISKALEAQTA